MDGAATPESGEPIPPAADFAHAVVTGLAKPQKEIPCRFLYDQAGSELFEEITHVPEYYPTRTEITVLKTHGAAIARHLPPGAAVVEFGAGSARKTPLFLNALEAPRYYVPIDISEDYLIEAAKNLAGKLPKLDVLPLPGDFNQPLNLPGEIADAPKIGFFPGSTIGNLGRDGAVRFLTRARQLLGKEAWFVAGVDLKKSEDLLVPAYDDAAGVTAAFNLNLLKRINRELGGNFDLNGFAHEARYNAREGRVEMHLVSLDAQTVEIAADGGRLPGNGADGHDGRHEFSFERGETIHTENSYKYSAAEFQEIAQQAGWRPVAVYTDDRALYSCHVLQAV